MKMCDTELPNHIILAQSILKNPEKFEWILQKGTELGVAEFYPVITHRTEALSLRKIDRLQRILVEATEQCGRCIVPILHEPVTFEKFLRLEFFDKKEVELIVPHLVADGSLADFSLNSRKCVVICIGPEGGFDENEIVAAREVGARIVTLGRRVLRSETAALSAVAQLAAKLDG
jgi:16S rRNA (uracil1498-N3)-methyltransferase